MSAPKTITLIVRGGRAVPHHCLASSPDRSNSAISSRALRRATDAAYRYSSPGWGLNPSAAETSFAKSPFGGLHKSSSIWLSDLSIYSSIHLMSILG